MKIKKRSLLLVAGLVWLIAGFNILRLGILSYQDYLSPINVTLSLIIFLIFWFMIFQNLVGKHTLRILEYEEELQHILRFFDTKSYILMAAMMTLGISIRTLKLLPEEWIAVFYSGLGVSLFMAGLFFIWQYISFHHTIREV